MFVGSFYRVRTKGDIDRMVSAASASAIIYVEDEHKFYEKTPFGMTMDYNLIPPVVEQPAPAPEKKESAVDENMEKRIKELEEAMKNLNNMIGGNINAI